VPVRLVLVRVLAVVDGAELQEAQAAGGAVLAGIAADARGAALKGSRLGDGVGGGRLGPERVRRRGGRGEGEEDGAVNGGRHIGFWW